MAYTDPITAWMQNRKGNGLKQPGVQLTPDQQELLSFNKPEQDALAAKHAQELYSSQISNAAATGTNATAQAVAAPTPYGYSSDTSGIQASAANNPFAGALAQSAASTQPYQADLDAAGAAARMAGQGAAALGGAGSFGDRTDAALGQFGDQVGKFDQDTNMLRDAASGKGPSAAAALAQSQLDANARQMSATAAGARGGNIAGGLRAALNAGGQAGLQGSQQIAALRAQEMAAAQQGLTGANSALTGARAQLAGATTSASQAETQRQAAAAAGGATAANALNGVAQTGVAGQGQVLNALSAGGQLYGQGQQTAVNAYTAGGNVAQAAANDLENQKRRALEAAQVMGQLNANNQSNNSAQKNQKIAAGAQTDISGGMLAGGLLSAGGQAVASAVGK